MNIGGFVIDLSQDQGTPVGPNTARPPFEAGTPRPFTSTESAGCLKDTAHLFATATLRCTDDGLDRQEMQVMHDDGVWAPKAPRAYIVRMSLGFGGVTTNLPHMCSKDLQRLEYQLPAPFLTTLMSCWDSGLPLFKTHSCSSLAKI